MIKRNIYNTNDKRNVIYQHKPTLYHNFIFPLWFIFSLILIYLSIRWGILLNLKNRHYVLVCLSIFLLLLNLSYFFLKFQNIMYVIEYQFLRVPQERTEQKLLSRPFPKDYRPKVALIYCTYNDWLPDCLYQCMQQTYPVDVKILDDSSKESYKRAINKFARVHDDQNIQIIRRKKHSWDKNKAGNLNHGLKYIKNQHYDFFVFLDSDELLEPRYVEKMLKEFYYGDKYGYHVGLIQASHVSGRNTNSFMHMNARSAEYFWDTQNVVRSAETGIRESNKDPHVLYRGDTICSNLGHGCMADARALYGSGLFPLLVSEDIANTVKMIHHGWNVYFSTQIKGNEETITSMQALKVRSYKFANGDLQWLRHFLRYIIHSKMLSFHQKIDVTALIGDTNIGGFLYVSVLIYNIIFPIFHGYVGSTAVFLIPLLFFLYSDTIIDIIYSLNCMSIWETIKREF